MKETTLVLGEEDRQLVLLAMAVLSLVNPGFRYALEEVAGRMGADGVAMFNEFRRLRADQHAGGMK